MKTLTRIKTASRLAVPALLCAFVSGCLTSPFRNSVAQGPNAVQVPSQQYDTMWERTVAVLNDNHFSIARESKIEGVIETEYRAGSGLFEPWHQDSVGYMNRLESTVQSIRRRVIVNFQNTTPEAVMVSVRVEKEIEDVPGLAATYEGGATFSDSQPLERNLDQVFGQPGPSRWLPRGNDTSLEAELMRQIQSGR